MSISIFVGLCTFRLTAVYGACLMAVYGACIKIVFSIFLQDTDVLNVVPSSTSEVQELVTTTNRGITPSS